MFVNWSRFIFPGDKAGRLGVLRFKVLFTAMLVAFVIYGLFQWVLWPVQILGDSMLPNYHAGERHFINKLAYLTDKPLRGDVVGVRVSNGDTYIKRIIGLPGEVVGFCDGVVYINGTLLQESYVETRVPKDFGMDGEGVKLRAETYYVMGDNRAVSVLGKISIGQIVGKVTF